MKILLMILLLTGCSAARHHTSFDSTVIIRDSFHVKHSMNDTVRFQKKEYSISHNKPPEALRKYGWLLIIPAVVLSIISIVLETRK